MKRSSPTHSGPRTKTCIAGAIVLACAVLGQMLTLAFDLEVVDRHGLAVQPPYRWLLEEDNTVVAQPGTPVNDSISLVIHKSHAPSIAAGEVASGTASIPSPDTAKRYIVSVLKEGYSLGAAVVPANISPTSKVRVILNQNPIPTAQISVLVFHDNNPINNAPDATEEGLPGFRVVIDDAAAGGPLLTDAFGNPLGTTYKFGPDGEPVMVDGAPVVETRGSGRIYTDANGKALIKYIAPGKYGVRVIPPTGTSWTGGHGSAMVKGTWTQTATIEGTLTVDAWVKANEPMVFLEGFGPSFFHVFFGFVDPAKLPWDRQPPASGITVKGKNIFNHFGRPPVNQMFAPGPAVDQAWVGLNEMNGGLPGRGLYAAPAQPDGSFEIPNVPPGTYQLVTWDKPLDALFGFNTITVEDPDGDGVADLGNVLSYRWFGTLEGSVFYDQNQNGFRDGINVPGSSTDAGTLEPGIPKMAVNLRFRDGRIYQATVTDAAGDYAFAEVFPFFKWLITEVDFSRFKATGLTAVTDEGGFIPGPDWPAEGVRNPQPQYAVDPLTGIALTDQPIINPNTGDNLSRTETGPVLLQAMHLFLNQNNRIDWGKVSYAAAENGGITGVVGYQTTRAEENPRDAVIDPWEPGIPRVQVALYRDRDGDKLIDDINGVPGIQLADVDNYPLGWASGGAKGPEDYDHNNNGVFDPGDAINIVWTDSWDDFVDGTGGTLGAIQTSPASVLGKPIVGADNYGTWNQIRPGVFDGGYAFNGYDPTGWNNNPDDDIPLPAGFYIVHAVPPPTYLIQTEESMNVGFGESYTPSKLVLPPELVGTRPNHGGSSADNFVKTFVPGNRTDPYTVAPTLSLFPDAGEPAPFAGQVRPLADMKWVRVSDGQNAAADFHMYTEVPKAARVMGFVLNDFTAEFNAFSPIFGEKGSPGWLPISFRDWAGNEIVRVYSDEYGTYNAMLPSTYTANVPSPSGVSPNMLTLVLNDPTMPDPANPNGPRIPDPFYNPNFSTTPWTFMYYPGSVSYLDTPIVPIAGLVGFPNNQLDVEPPDGAPVIKSVSGTGVGPYLASPTDLITITSLGNTEVPDPTSLGYQSSATITRDYGFGDLQGNGRVTINGVALEIVSWGNNEIKARLPSTLPSGNAWQLEVIRNNGKHSPIGVTLTLAGPGNVHYVTPQAPSEADPIPNPIQDAIDAAAAGDLILVGEGNYNENLILWKPVRLQGSGAGTVILANPNPLDRVTAWHESIKTRLGGDPFVANELPGIIVFSTAPDAFKSAGARIDGFQIKGSIAGGGISLFNNVHDLRISNNRIIGNQGTYGGGISIGMQGNTGILYDNTNVTIERNQILKNGGVTGAGGIAIYTGATGYRIVNNDIVGNFCRQNGGGIAHEGLSPNGLIAGNRIAFNEVFYGILVGGDGGGIYVTGELLPAGLGQGAGSLTIINNLIQGNLAGSGHGGGIRVASFNGTDVQAAKEDWYALDIINNVIVNNVAGWAGGGISLQDVARVRIIHNTIARNDSTATSRSAFAPGANVSENQVAGIAAHQHGILLASFVAPETFANPVLENNIIYENRSHRFNGSTGFQSLENPVIWDLGVVEQPSATLNPINCVLTAAYAGGSGNIYGAPNFLAPYYNTLHSAVVIDEAGNNISIRLEQPASTTPPVEANYGDYHIGNSSAAIDAASPSSPAAFDIDLQARPSGTAADIGADEANSTAVSVDVGTTAPATGPLPDGVAPPVTTPPNGAGVPPGDPVLPVFEPMPADQDGLDTDGDGDASNDHYYMRVTGGDGFARMADGNELYQFGFANLTEVDPTHVMREGMLKAEIPAPTIRLKEGQKFYLDLSNVGMLMRPDLFDPHSVHFHGFPQAASIFDGEPFASAVINVGATFRYFYNIVEPGTYVYHCHVEATEHMEMGMLGSLYITPKQNYAHIGPNGPLAPADYPTFTKLPPGKGPKHQPGYKYAYNDGDGSTYYDVEKELQLSAFDRNFHEQHILVQPLPFSDLDESYPLINGRGYPDTVAPAPVVNSKVQEVLGLEDPYPSQKIDSRVVATSGQRILLRLSNVSLSDFHTVTVLGIPMRVIGKDAKLLRSPTGLDLSYETSSVTIGPGETADVILDTAGVAPGTYFLYDARLNHLCNDEEDFGGMMTEIVVQ